MSWVAVAGGVISAGAGIYSANKAAKSAGGSQMDPRVFKMTQQNYEGAKRLPGYHQYMGQLSPGVPQATNNAIAGAQGIMGYQPQQVAAPFGAPKARAATVQQVAPVTAQTGLGGIEQYMNPYTQQVIDASMQDIDRQRQMSQVGNAQQSTMGGGAFGGSRLGVREAETNRAYGDLAAQTAAGLRMGGYNQATGLLQSDYDRTLAAQQGNQGIAAGRASQIGSQQQQTNLANQGANLTNTQMGLQAQMANQGAGLQGAGLNLNAADSLGRLGLGQFGMESQGMNAAYQEFLRSQNAPYLKQDALNSALGLFGGGQVSKNSAPAGVGMATAGGLMQGFGSMYDLYNNQQKAPAAASNIYGGYDPTFWGG